MSVPSGDSLASGERPVHVVIDQGGRLGAGERGCLGFCSSLPWRLPELSRGLSAIHATESAHRGALSLALENGDRQASDHQYRGNHHPQRRFRQMADRPGAQSRCEGGRRCASTRPAGPSPAATIIFHHLKKLAGRAQDSDRGEHGRDRGQRRLLRRRCAVGRRPNTIFAEPTTWTGSIGVIIPHYDLAELMEKLAVTDDSIVSNPLKLTGSPTRKVTGELAEKEKAILQTLVDETFKQFKEIVVERGRSWAKIPRRSRRRRRDRCLQRSRRLTWGSSTNWGSSKMRSIGRFRWLGSIRRMSAS